ncbi:MAG: TetR family transcriptional regulator [Deltaproteobacteria bacterium]|nr:TetR family transcriptional regulator [Deltaproteobacteria bacterium]
MTLEEIAEEASVHVQTLHRHFKNKINLAMAIDIFDHKVIRTLLMDPNQTEDVRSMWRKNQLH